MVEANISRGTTNREHYSNLSTDTLSAWNFLRSLTSFRGKTRDSVAKCRLFSEARLFNDLAKN